ncbi:MAG: aldehyde dehydrogenase family protein [Burkholderiales bacterium]|nr:aldehyde dehydrogenase family protein [Burkholderiales bacterium]
MGATDTAGAARAAVAAIVARARAAQAIAERWTQRQADDAALAAGWAIMAPERNRALAELAVRDTGLGNVEDKLAKNHRKTLGLLRDLAGAKTVGVIASDPARGLVEIARPIGVVAAITPSTNPGATPANNIVNALKCRNAIVLAPSPKGATTAAKLVEFVHAELDRVGAPRDLVQLLPAPVTRDATLELMRQADLVVATGSQANIRAAYSSGTPALGVGAGNVAAIVDASADPAAAAKRIALSKTFDNATSCSSENSVVVLDAVYRPTLAALAAEGGVLLDAGEKERLARTMWPDGRLSPAVTAQAAPRIAALAGLAGERFARARFLMVEETGTGPAFPFSGEKLSPVLAVYRVADFDAACATVRAIYAYQGAGHSVGIHTADDAQPMRLAEELPVARVIVNQAHCIATGGSFDNGLPFSLSMGCGSWGKNSFSDNLNYRHFLNVTRIARPIPAVVPAEDEIFGDWLARYHGGA